MWLKPFGISNEVFAWRYVLINGGIINEIVVSEHLIIYTLHWSEEDVTVFVY